MLILGIDCSATPASAALVNEQGTIIGEFFINTKLTHSQTLLPMVDALLKCTNTDISQVDLFAVAAGPGSFTGVRIGVAAVKGMAMAQNKPCVAVSTLEAMAENIKHMDCIVCSVMDARCSQVYNALHKVSGETVTRLCDDRALSIESLTTELKQYNKRIILVGDGAKLCYQTMRSQLDTVELAPENLLYQRAGSVALAGIKEYTIGKFMPAQQLLPTYLRLPQAERELRKKQQESAT